MVTIHTTCFIISTKKLWTSLTECLRVSYNFRINHINHGLHLRTTSTGCYL